MVRNYTGIIAIFTGLLFLVGIGGLLVWLYEYGCLPQDFAYLGAKALLAYGGPEPRFEAFGYVFPPFIIYGVLLTGTSPIFFQALVGGCLAGLVVQQMGRVDVPNFWRILWVILILLHPSFLLMVLYRPDWTTAVLILMAAMTLLLDLAQERDQRLLSTGLALVLLGLTLAPLMLVRFEAWLLLPLLGVILLMIFHNTEPVGFQVSSVLVVLFMSCVAIGAFLYFNWITTDDAFFFVNSPYGSLQSARNLSLIRQEKIFPSIGATLQWLIPIAPAYLITCFGIVQSTSKHRWGLGLILFLPIIMLILSFWQGIFFPSASRFGVFLGLLPVIWWHAAPQKLLSRLLLTVALVVSSLYMVTLQEQNLLAPEETLLWSQITGRSPAVSMEVQQAAQQCEAEKEIARVLSGSLDEGQVILADDTVASPVLYRIRRPKAFVLPYQYEFLPALQNPELFVNYILLANAASPTAARDRVGSFWLQNSDSEIPGFQVVRENAYFRLLQRI